MKAIALVFLIVTVAFPGYAQQSEGTSTTGAPTLPKWNLSLSSHYYSFEGRRAAVTQLYHFGDISTRMDFFNLNYALTPKWSVNLLFQHYDSFIESLFPRAPRPEWLKSNDRIVGMGDTYLTANRTAMLSPRLVLIGQIGASLPTGGIDYKARNLIGLESINMAYNAQLGSGTVDGLASLTLMSIHPQWQAGAKSMALLRTGRNSFDYRLGNHYRVDGWLDWNLKSGLTPRLTGYYRHKDAISGFDRTRGFNSADNFFYNKQIDWQISPALQYKKNFPQSKLVLTGEIGVPLLQENINVDNAFVAINYYANLGLTAMF